MADNNVLKFRRPPKKPDPNVVARPSPVVAVIVAVITIGALAAIYFFMR